MKKTIIKFIVSIMALAIIGTTFVATTVKADTFKEHFSVILNSSEFDNLYYYAQRTGSAKGLSKDKYLQKNYSLYLTEPEKLKKQDVAMYNFMKAMQKKYSGMFPDKNTIKSLQRGTLNSDHKKEEALRAQAERAYAASEKAKAEAEQRQWNAMMNQLAAEQAEQERIMSEQYRALQEMMKNQNPWQ